MRKLPVIIAAAVSFDLGSFGVASAVMPSDYLLKIDGIDGESTEQETAPRKSAADTTRVDTCFWGECRSANIPTINVAGCNLIGGTVVTIDAQAACKVPAPQPSKPKVGVRVGIPVPGMSGSGRTTSPDH